MNRDSDGLFYAGFEQNALSLGIRLPVKVDLRSVPHLLIVAPSGSGKTHLLTFILGQLARKDGGLILADFKGIDFTALDGCRHYYKHSAVAEALSHVFGILQERMADPQSGRKILFLVIDEWSGFLSLYPKKEQEGFKQQLASILMLGRGVGIFVILALQRADAGYLTGRDNFGNCIGLGTLSRESISMTFSDHRDSIIPKGRGKGYLATDGRPLQEIVVPRIRNIKGTMGVICSALDG